MEQLPELALIEVFNSLPLYDQQKNRSVCKRWKAIIENSLSCRKELVLFYRICARPLVWFHSGRSVDLLGSLIVNENFKNSPVFDRLFKSIKRLYLVCRPKELLESNFINLADGFHHLEHLQVNTLIFTVFPNSLKIQLNLPNLKSFCYNTAQGRTKLLQLDCPKLEKLSVSNHFVMDKKCAPFKESLKFLKVASFQCEQKFYFPNLEVLYCQNVLPIDIAPHQKLKEIHFFWEHFSCTDSIFLTNEPNQIAVLNGLFEQKRLLGRSELQIYYQGNECCAL